jgi:hypothetical protein
MNPLQLHVGVANAVVIFNAVLGLWGLYRFWKKQNIEGNYWGALALSPLLGLVQLGLGLWLISLGLGTQVRFVHYLYGALVVIGVPSAFAFTNGRDDYGMSLFYGGMCLLIAGFGLRGVTTGYNL